MDSVERKFVILYVSKTKTTNAGITSSNLLTQWRVLTYTFRRFSNTYAAQVGRRFLLLPLINNNKKKIWCNTVKLHTNETVIFCIYTQHNKM